MKNKIYVLFFGGPMSTDQKLSRGGIFAIDYGTSNSLLSYVTADHVTQPLPLDASALDPTVFRSLLYFPHQDACFYGQEAITAYNQNSGEGRFIRSMKKYLPSTSFVGSYIDSRVVRLEDLIGFFLLEMRKRANEYLGFEVDRVILGRPAKYSLNVTNDKMAEYRMKKAAEFAGFKEVHFLPEPVAAAFDLRSRIVVDKVVLVVDLGGGTSDFTVIRIGPRKYHDSDLLGLGGVSLAGDVIDGEIMKNDIAEFFGADVKYRVPLGNNIQQMPPVLKDSLSSAADIVQLQRRQVYDFFKNVKDWTLKESDRDKLKRLEILVEDQLGFAIYEVIDYCKRSLSANAQVEFDFNYPDIEIRKMLYKNEFSDYVDNTLENIMLCLQDTLKVAQITPQDIDLVYCTGGTSKLSLVSDKLMKIFGPEKMQSSDHFHSVTKGLALRVQELLF